MLDFRLPHTHMIGRHQVVLVIRSQSRSAVMIGGLAIVTALVGSLSAFSAITSDQTDQAAWCTIQGTEVGVDDYSVRTPTIGPIWCP